MSFEGFGHVRSDYISGNDDGLDPKMAWQMRVESYNISVLMRYESDHKVWLDEPKTFRIWFICVPGKVVTSGRRTIVRMSKHSIYADRWQQFSDKILLKMTA